MITIEKDTVAGDMLFSLLRNFYVSFGSIGDDRHLFCLVFVKRAGERAVFLVKWNALSYVIFISADYSSANFLVLPELPSLRTATGNTSVVRRLRATRQQH